MEAKEEEENISRRKIFGQRRKSRTEKGKEENILEKERDDAQIYVPMV